MVLGGCHPIPWLCGLCLQVRPASLRPSSWPASPDLFKFLFQALVYIFTCSRKVSLTTFAYNHEFPLWIPAVCLKLRGSRTPKGLAHAWGQAGGVVHDSPKIVCKIQRACPCLFFLNWGFIVLASSQKGPQHHLFWWLTVCYWMITLT